MSRGWLKTYPAAREMEPPQLTHPLLWVLGLLSLVPLCIIVPMAPPRLGVAALAIWIAVIWAVISLARNQFHYLVPIWVAIYPYCYYLLSYPTERSIFTIDRAFIILMVVAIFVAVRRPLPPDRDLQISGYLWAVYLLVCFLSLRGHNPTEILPSYRFLIDGMVMPAVFGLYIIRHFPLVRDLGKLHVGACVLGLGLFLTGLIEVTTEIDLFPWTGSEPMYTDTHLRRADGPFEQQVVLSVVAILAFFFILYLGRVPGEEFSARRKLLHRTACFAAMGAALLPLNRGLIFALVPIACIEFWSQHRLIPRRIWAGFFTIILLSMIAARTLNPRLYQDRVSDPNNFYQRLAQHQETLRVVQESPLFGVGFGLYHEVAIRNPQYMARWNGIESMNVPHNVLMTVLSEEGVLGLFLYVTAQVFFIRAMWKIRAAYTPGWLAFVYCVLVYVLIGLDYATVSFADINLLYMLILGSIYQLQMRIVAAQRDPGTDRPTDAFPAFCT
jgi:hypothetical protein